MEELHVSALVDKLASAKNLVPLTASPLFTKESEFFRSLNYLEDS